MSTNWKRRDETLAFSGYVSVRLITPIGSSVVWGGDNAACFSCHKDESLSKQDARGRKVSLFVAEKEYESSIHGSLSCSDCHTQIRDDGHAAGGKAIDRRVNCASCHQEAEKEYKKGLHSKMIMKGTERAAYCQDCHGKHRYSAEQRSQILDPSFQYCQDLQPVPFG